MGQNFQQNDTSPSKIRLSLLPELPGTDLAGDVGGATPPNNSVSFGKSFVGSQ